MHELNRHSQVKRNILSGTLTATGGIVVSIVGYPIYLHFLGAELYGLWAVLTVIIFFSSIGNFGIDEALIKYIAEEYERKNIENIVEFISTGINLLLVNGIIIFIILKLLENLLLSVLNLISGYVLVFKNIYTYIVIIFFVTIVLILFL